MSQKMFLLPSLFLSADLPFSVTVFFHLSPHPYMEQVL